MGVSVRPYTHKDRHCWIASPDACHYTTVEKAVWPGIEPAIGWENRFQVKRITHSAISPRIKLQPSIAPSSIPNNSTQSQSVSLSPDPSPSQSTLRIPTPPSTSCQPGGGGNALKGPLHIENLKRALEIGAF